MQAGLVHFGPEGHADAAGVEHAVEHLEQPLLGFERCEKIAKALGIVKLGLIEQREAGLDHEVHLVIARRHGATTEIDRETSAPGIADMLTRGLGLAVDRSTDLMLSAVFDLADTSGGMLQVVELNLRCLEDVEERKRLLATETAPSLPAQRITDLIRAGRTLVEESSGLEPYRQTRTRPSGVPSTWVPRRACRPRPRP